MTQATVTIQYVNEVKPGKKWGSVKTPEGVIFGVPPQLLPQFQAGGTYTIDYTEGDSGFKGVNNVWPAQGAPVAPPQPVQQPMPPMPAPMPSAPVPAPGGHTGPPGMGIDAKAEDIFVTGVVGRCFHGTGTLPDAGTLTEIMQNLRMAWKAGHKPAQTIDATGGVIEDEIPF